MMCRDEDLEWIRYNQFVEDNRIIGGIEELVTRFENTFKTHVMKKIGYEFLKDAESDPNIRFPTIEMHEYLNSDDARDKEKEYLMDFFDFKLYRDFCQIAFYAFQGTIMEPEKNSNPLTKRLEFMEEAQRIFSHGGIAINYCFDFGIDKDNQVFYQERLFNNMDRYTEDNLILLKSYIINYSERSKILKEMADEKYDSMRYLRENPIDLEINHSAFGFKFKEYFTIQSQIDDIRTAILKEKIEKLRKKAQI